MIKNTILLRNVPYKYSGTQLTKSSLSSYALQRLYPYTAVTRNSHISQRTNESKPASLPNHDIVLNDRALKQNASSFWEKSDPNLDYTFIGLTGGHIFHEMMIRHNVDVIFGYPGGAILPVYDAIHNSSSFKFVLPKHEQGAGHMAEGYARVSGKPGIVLVTSGPGATNVTTPMANAFADGIPMIVFTGQVPTSVIGTDSFQEADILGISRHCTKWNTMVKSVEELPRRINQAFEIATSGRPGPVLIDLPKNVTAAILRKPILLENASPRCLDRYHSNIFRRESLDQNIIKAAHLINISKKPVLYVRDGVINNLEGSHLLKEISDRAQIPVTTSIHGLGSFNQDDPKSLHMLGMYGSVVANLAVENADLIIAFGSRFNDCVTGNITAFASCAMRASQEKKGGIINFEASTKNRNKVVQSDVTIEGDITTNLNKLLKHVLPVKTRNGWFDQIRSWKQKYYYYYKNNIPSSKIQPQIVITGLSKIAYETGKEIIVTSGFGQHQLWVAQYWEWKNPSSFITSSDFGTMGFGLPSAIGAQIANPNALVIDIDDYNSFNMTLNELSSAVQAKTPVKILILNNYGQGMETQWQSVFYNNRYTDTHLQNPDFMKLAESMHVKGIRVTEPDKLEEALRKFVFTEGPVLMEVEVEDKC